MTDDIDDKLICPDCKAIVSLKETQADMEYGGNGMCSCRYMTYDSEGEPVFMREFVEYVPLKDYLRTLEGSIIRREEVKYRMSPEHHWVFVELLEFPEGNDKLLLKMEAAVGCYMSELQTALFYRKGFLTEAEAKAYKKSLEIDEFENYLYADYYVSGQLKEV